MAFKVNVINIYIITPWRQNENNVHKKLTSPSPKWSHLMKTMTIFLLGACAASTAMKAQSTQAPSPRKGILGLLDKATGDRQGAPKGKLPPPPPTIRTTTAQHAQRTLQSTYGRSYILVNLRDLTTEQRSQHESALTAKNGFMGYQFGMSAEAFVAEAQKRGERFHKASGELSSGKDFLCTTPTERQEVAGVPVEATYTFYKGKLARIAVKPHPSHPDLTAKELRAVYDAFSAAYGPGDEKILISKAWAPTPFTGCEELLTEDALHKVMSTMLAEGQARGGFRPDQIGENLTFCGYWWSSDAVEINFSTATDVSQLEKAKSGIWGQNAGEKTFSISLTSKSVLGPFLAEALAAKGRAAAKGI